MNKKERFEAVRQMKAPDYMPVWSRVKIQMIYAHGFILRDVTGEDWYDAEKITEAVLASINNIGYDVAIPYYVDMGFSIGAIGGKVNFPTKFGLSPGPLEDQKPVMTKADWPRVQKILAHFDNRKDCPRMKGALEVIKNVSKEVGNEVPLVTIRNVGAAAVRNLLRPSQAFLEDMMEDPEWVDEMCRVATDWAIDSIRAQYEAGANSATFISDVIGTEMVSPAMNERFNLESFTRVVETIKKEFNQGCWLHIHGDMKTPKAYEYLTKLAKEVNFEGFHFDEKHSSEWVKEHVVDKLGKPACIIVDGSVIDDGPVEKIREEVKSQISKVGEGLGLMMAPSCQVLPATQNEHFKAWVDATHEYGKYPLNTK